MPILWTHGVEPPAQLVCPDAAFRCAHCGAWSVGTGDFPYGDWTCADELITFSGNRRARCNSQRLGGSSVFQPIGGLFSWKVAQRAFRLSRRGRLNRQGPCRPF
jgi:hypothetical protein